MLTRGWSFAVTGQATILAGSLVEAWIFPALTADHTADEHLLESFKVMAGNVVAGVGFTIYGVNTSEITERPLGVYDAIGSRGGGAGKGTRIYGKWNVGWVWN